MTSATATHHQPLAGVPAFAGDGEGLGRVVVGVHGSDRSLAALDWAARLAASRGWELVVVTAWPEPEEVFVHDVPGHHSQPRSRAATQLAGALTRLSELGAAVTVVPQLVNAPVSAALLDACDAGSVLVVGASRVEEHEDPSLRGVDEVCSLLAPGSLVVIDLDPAVHRTTAGRPRAGRRHASHHRGGAMEAHVTHWTVEVYLSERDGQTHADARLVSGVTRPLHAVGTARLNPHDRMDVPEVGYEVAGARALHNLADLLETSAQRDVEALRRD